MYRKIGYPKCTAILICAYQVLMICLILKHYSQLKHAPILLIFHTLTILLQFFYFVYAKKKALVTIQIWMLMLIPILIVNYLELQYLVPAAHPVSYDQNLAQIDLILFSNYLGLWLEKCSTPFLTEVLQIIYSTFYFIPFLLAYRLHKANDRARFNYFAFVIVLGFYLSYIGYFIVPASGPWLLADMSQTETMSGLYLTKPIRATLDLLDIDYDAFPSGHTTVTLITTCFAKKWDHLYYRYLLVICPCLVFSTVYLRYHYIIDVFAGSLLAVLVIFISPTLYRNLLRSSQVLVLR